MHTIARLALLAVLFLVPSQGRATHCQDLESINHSLHGLVVDYTHNHGRDRRIWSAALCQKRDLYVYLPPGYDPTLHYPVILYLHGYLQDEGYFLNKLVPHFDAAMAGGTLPPAIVACPDGSIRGRPSVFDSVSFYANSRAGAFEAFVMQDVWPFLLTQYPIRPEREAHAVVGGSAGGSAAYRLAIKYPDVFRVVVGIFPALNMRWEDCHGHYCGRFDPCCWGWRTRAKPLGVIGRYYGVGTVRYGQLIRPLFGTGAAAIEGVSGINPIELLGPCHIQPGQLCMYIAYGGKDQFNIEAQVRSFLHVAAQLGLCVDVDFDPKGKHDRATANKFFPNAAKWLAPLLAPYSPAPAAAR